MKFLWIHRPLTEITEWQEDFILSNLLSILIIITISIMTFMAYLVAHLLAPIIAYILHISALKPHYNILRESRPSKVKGSHPRSQNDVVFSGP